MTDSISFQQIAGIALKLFHHRNNLLYAIEKCKPLIEEVKKTWPIVFPIIKNFAEDTWPNLKISENNVVIQYNVEWIQSNLNKLNHILHFMEEDLIVDNDYGSKTKEAVAAYQKFIGIEVDGWAFIETCYYIDRNLKIHY